MTPDTNNKNDNEIGNDGNDTSWTWTPPDLQVGSGFYNNRVRSLGKATKESGLNDSWLHQGLKILQEHRSNYG